FSPSTTAIHVKVVDGGELAGDADGTADAVGVPGEIGIRDGRAAGVRRDQRDQDVDDRGLAGAVRAGQREHAAPLDVEVDAVKDHLAPVGLAKPTGRYGVHVFPCWVQARRTVTSPNAVLAWISTLSACSEGASDAVISLRTRPNSVLTSSHAVLPSRIPTSISPIPVSSVSDPRTASSTRTAPFADFASTSSAASSTVTSPLAARTLTGACAALITVLPLEFFSSPPLASSPTCRRPAVVTVALPVTRLPSTFPVPEVTDSAAASSNWMWPSPVLYLRSPRRPVAVRSPVPLLPCTCHPARRWTVVSIA